MPVSKKSGFIPGHAAAIDFPGLHGFKGLAYLISRDDGQRLFAPGYEVGAQTVFTFKVFLGTMRHFCTRTTDDLESLAEQSDIVSMNYLGARYAYFVI